MNSPFVAGFADVAGLGGGSTVAEGAAVAERRGVGGSVRVGVAATTGADGRSATGGGGGISSSREDGAALDVRVTEVVGAEGAGLIAVERSRADPLSSHAAMASPANGIARSMTIHGSQRTQRGLWCGMMAVGMSCGRGPEGGRISGVWRPRSR